MVKFDKITVKLDDQSKGSVTITSADGEKEIELAATSGIRIVGGANCIPTVTLRLLATVEYEGAADLTFEQARDLFPPFSAIPELDDRGGALTTDEELKKSGLTADEAEIMAALILAWNKYISLAKREGIRNDDIQAFQGGIHFCQQLIAYRIVQHMYPDFWQ